MSTLRTHLCLTFLIQRVECFYFELHYHLILVSWHNMCTNKTSLSSISLLLCSTFSFHLKRSFMLLCMLWDFLLIYGMVSNGWQPQVCVWTTNYRWLIWRSEWTFAMTFLFLHWWSTFNGKHTDIEVYARVILGCHKYSRIILAHWVKFLIVK